MKNMLLDRARELQTELRQHLDLKAAAAEAAVYKSRAAQFLPLAEGVVRARANYIALRNAGIPVAQVDAKQGLRSQARDLLDRFKADRTALAHADSTVRFEFMPGVQKATKDLEGAARTAWLEHTNIGAEFPTEDVLQALNTIPAYRTSVQAVRRAVERLNRLRVAVPSAADVTKALTELEDTRTEKDNALAAMQGSDLPAEVLVFLKKTGQGGAVLSDLTEPVQAWLISRGLMGAFRIVGAGRS